MKRVIDVVLGHTGHRVGVLRYNRDGARESASFEYDVAWLDSDRRFRIDPTLPLASGPQFRPRVRDGSIFHSAIADSEPDGWAAKVILRDHAKRRAIAKSSGADVAPLLGRLDFLLAVDDFSRVGALRFRDETGAFQRDGGPGERTAPPLIELAELLASTRAVETNTETARDLEYLRGRATSLGGLRPKCTIIDADGALAIGKFPSVHDERSYPRGEVLALRLAADAGIHAAAARVELSDGVPVAVIRRFDRAGERRLLFVSAATLMSVAPGEAVEHTYTEMADAIRQFSAAVTIDLEELWRRVAFSVLITNVDDHLRNHGFLHVERELWRLSPAFDVNPFPDRVRELKTWISEDTGPTASVDALMSVVPYFGMKRDRARAILAEVDGAVARWRRVGTALGMTALDLEQFANAFDHDERLAAQREFSAAR